MSYDIVNKIEIENNKVYITCASSNLYPRTFESGEWKMFTKILEENGIEALELEIFKEFENGNFHGRVKKYSNCLKRLFENPEYKQYNWRSNEIDYAIISKNRKTERFMELLKDALKHRSF